MSSEEDDLQFFREAADAIEKESLRGTDTENRTPTTTNGTPTIEGGDETSKNFSTVDDLATAFVTRPVLNTSDPLATCENQDAGSKGEDGSLSAGDDEKEEDDIDFGKDPEDFHVVTKVLDRQADKGEWLKEKVAKEYLPYFVEKFASLTSSEVEDLNFLEDQKLDYCVNQLHNAFSSHPGTPASYRLVAELLEILSSCEGLFFAFRKLLEIVFQNKLTDEGFDEPSSMFRPSITYMITCLMLNAADGSQEFARRLCLEPGLLELFVWMLRQLKDRHLTKTNVNESSENLLLHCLNIIYNCSIFDENRQRLLEVGSLEASIPYLESKEKDPQKLAFLIVAYLADEEQSEILKAKRELIENLVETLKFALAEPSRRFLGWAATELLRGLERLSRNDNNKKLIIDCGAIDILLAQIFQKNAPEEERVEAMKALWTLSFDEAAKKILKDCDEAVKLLDEIATAVPKHKCRKAAKGILWNLRDAETFHPAEVCLSPHIMISYQWDAKPMVLKVRDALKSAGYKVWVDVDNMEGSTINAMAEAVENSAVLLMCMSHGYKESRNCRSETHRHGVVGLQIFPPFLSEVQVKIFANRDPIPLITEAEYAYDRKKDIIPLVVETKYKPDGWLGFIKGAKLYYDITNQATFDGKMQQLIKALGSRGKYSETNVPPVPARRHRGTEENSPNQRQLKQWDREQVKKWMATKGISGENLGEPSGEQLHFLQRMLQRAPEYYYSFLERNISRLDEFRDLTALTNALDETIP